MVSATLVRIGAILAEEFDVNLPREDMSAGTPLFDGGLDLDSFAIVGVIARLEEDFGFEFSSDELQASYFRNLGTLSQLVAQKLAAAGAQQDSGDAGVLSS